MRSFQNKGKTSQSDRKRHKRAKIAPKFILQFALCCWF